MLAVSLIARTSSRRMYSAKAGLTKRWEQVRERMAHTSAHCSGIPQQLLSRLWQVSTITPPIRLGSSAGPLV